jgi:TPP-dependent pyruvate/acetoin dehydrogenase alpha subunit
MTIRSRKARRAAESEEASETSKSPLSPDLPRRLYERMLACRMVEEQLRAFARRGRLQSYCCSPVGREAMEVAATIDLRPEDAVGPSERDFVVSIMKGAELKDVFAQLCTRGARARVRSGFPEPTRDSQLATSVIAAQLNLGTGIALAYKMQHRANVVITLCGEASLPFCIWEDALGFAALHKLPIVYVVENKPQVRAQSAATDLSVVAQQYGIPFITVDGKDAIAVYRVCYEMRERARQGYGPTVVECRTCRQAEASTAESTSGKRPTSARCGQMWGTDDPLQFMECYLRRKGLWDEGWKQRTVETIKRKLQKAVASSELRVVSRAVPHLTTHRRGC